MDKGSGRGWKMETQWIWPATKRKLPPLFFPPALWLELIALHRSCKGVGDYILILQLTLLEAPFEWNPRVLSKKPYYGNDLTRGGRKKVFKTSFRFFFSSWVAGKDHKTMKNNGLTASHSTSCDVRFRTFPRIQFEAPSDFPLTDRQSSTQSRAHYSALCCRKLCSVSWFHTDDVFVSRNNKKKEDKIHRSVADSN